MKITTDKYTEDMPVVMQFRIEAIIKRMQECTGLEKLKAIQEYKLKAQLYNNIVGYACYHLGYIGTKESEY